MQKASMKAVAKKLPEDVRNALGLKKGATFADGVATIMVNKAMKGDVAATRFLQEVIEGKPRQRIEVDLPPKPTPEALKEASNALREAYGLAPVE
jgi:hypothetical protein